MKKSEGKKIYKNFPSVFFSDFRGERKKESAKSFELHLIDSNIDVDNGMKEMTKAYTQAIS